MIYMRRLLSGLLVLLTAISCNEPRTAPAQVEVLPVTGTWVNLSWQDERNNYTNFRDEALNTDPELWRDKMCELHDIGVDYIVIMQVANEGKAYYPSSLYPKLYPEGRKSPVEAIMDACDSLGMHVFMSCGWAYDQDDNVGDPAVVERQCRMMDELGGLYGDRGSFYGWYLPIEDCLIPYLPERSVEGINRLVARARTVTPGKKTMAAPYGIFGAELDNPLFREQLAKIDIDIIAYQDEVGCVRERFPMQRMKDNFRKLGQIHEDLGIEFWVDLETFTWEKGTNSRQSALIPAEFGRVLSQIVGASRAGVGRITSFAVCGLFDKPGSRHPLGQPAEAELAYANYSAWLSGDPHWKMLESIFTGEAVNDAAGAAVSYSSSGLPSAGASRRQAFLPKLTDGQTGHEDVACREWFKSARGMDVTLDLGSVHSISAVAPHFLNYTPDSIKMPAKVEIYTSVDGSSFSLAASGPGPHAVNDRHDCWSDVAYFPDLGEARYLRVVAATDEWSGIACDEIFVKY